MPRTGRHPTHPVIRFFSHVRRDGGCWWWTGALDPDGYGRFKLSGRTGLAHRAAWRLAYGADAPMALDHLCRNRACVRPSHLEPVTAKENTHRSHHALGIGMAATACKRGHPLDEENTYQWSVTGQRRCRVCNNSAVARYRARGGRSR